MSKQILISIITNDLAKSTKFYESIGFINQSQTPNTQGSQMKWSDEIMFMLLSTELAIILNQRNKNIVDQHKNVSAVFSFILNSKEEVDQFCENAKANGGKVYGAEDEDEIMYSFEVEDPDGYILQPTFMDSSKMPN